MIIFVMFSEWTHSVIYTKPKDSKPGKNYGLCQKLRKALNHITADPKY